MGRPKRPGRVRVSPAVPAWCSDQFFLLELVAAQQPMSGDERWKGDFPPRARLGTLAWRIVATGNGSRWPGRPVAPTASPKG